jgi:hypothetical protein
MQLTKPLATRLLVLLAVLAATLFVTAGALAAPVANQIIVRDQNLDTGIAVVDSVTAANNGWVVIYNKPDFTVENLVGYAPVHEGSNLGVKVVVSLPKINNAPALWAVLQSDKGTPGIFEWGLKERAFADAPLMENGKAVTTQFHTTAPSTLPPFLEMPSGGASLKTLPANQIAVRDQNVGSGIILVDAITATEPGWVVFYKNPNFTPGEIVGFAPVYSGVNTNVKATIDTTKLGKSNVIWAQLHRDDGRRGVFEWQSQTEPISDWPLIQNQKYARASFGTTSAAPVPTTTVALKAAQIAVHDQDLGSGIIAVDAITTPVNGWIVIYKNPNFTSGEIVGYAPVYKGTNNGVKVTIDTAKVGDLPRLWPVLHADGGLPNVFEWGYRGRGHNDPPLLQNGKHVSSTFRTMEQPAIATSK